MRHLGHVLWFLVLWPAATALLAPAALGDGEMFSVVPAHLLLLGCTAMVGRMWREFLLVGLLLAGAAALVGRACRSATPGAGRWRALGIGLIDAAFTAAALTLGICLELPGVLRHPGLLMRYSSVGAATVALAGAVACLALVLRYLSRGAARTERALAVGAVVVVAGALLARTGPLRSPSAAARTQVLLGLDSISQLDDVAPLRRFASERGGTWYEYPVTPGLLTNAVWTAILSGRPVAETGVYFVFQSPDWSRVPDNLVSRATRAGIHTVAFFSDQFTTHVGSDAPFVEDRSGPKGWMQVGTAAVKDVSLFLPVILPHLPRIPGGTPPNQSGTYAYSLRRELLEILTAGRAGRSTLAIGHLDYLHQPRFPGYSELSWEERRRVLSSPVWALADTSMNWQYTDDTPWRPVALYRHKLARLQRVLAEAVAGSGFLDPALHNSLAVLSDHGLRSGVAEEAFADPRYHRVVLVTFGVPARDPQRPISTLDVGSLLALADAPPAKPEVAYVNVRGDEWFSLRGGSRLLRDGGVKLEGAVLAAIGQRLLTYAPYADRPAYQATPASPAVERQDRPELLSGGALALDSGDPAAGRAPTPGT